MARVYMATQGWGVLQDTSGNVVGSQAVTIKNRSDGTNATHYSARTGGTSSTAAFASTGSGLLNRWIDPGEYTITVGANTYDVDAVPGAASIFPVRLELFAPRGGDGLTLDMGITSYDYLTAFSANTARLHESLAGTLIEAETKVIWVPNATGNGIRLMHFEDGLVNETVICEFTGSASTTPIVSSQSFTATIQALIDGTVRKHLGFQFKCNGVVGSVLYGVWVELLFRVRS
jgi:hypothetical protein